LEITEQAFDDLKFSKMENLWPERWDRLSSGDRAITLQECENRLAQYEKRKPAKVEVIDYEKNPETADRDILGTYYERSNVIGISPSQLEKGKVYDAFYRVVHESGHAFQSHVDKNPGVYTDAFRLQDWEEGRRTYQVPVGNDPEEQRRYENNPLERDASLRGKLFSRLLREGHERKQSQRELKKELREVQQARGNLQGKGQIRPKDDKPASRSVTFNDGLSVEVRENVPKAGFLEITIRQGRERNTLRVQMPDGYEAKHLDISSEREAQHLLRLKRHESGNLKFVRPSERAPESGQKKTMDKESGKERKQRRSLKRDR